MTTTTTAGCCPLPAIPPLVKETTTSLSALFATLADPTRLQLLYAIKHANRPLCVCELTSLLPIAQSTVSYHLTRLRSLGFLESEQRGVWSYFSLPTTPSSCVHQLLEILP